MLSRKDSHTVDDSAAPSEEQLSDQERRAALASIGKFAKYTGPGLALLLASEQAVASGCKDCG